MSAYLLNSVELMPSKGQKSFYKKAFVENWLKAKKDIFVLKSYNTRMLVVYEDKLYREYRVEESNFTQTTLKHCRAFVEQYCALKDMRKKDFLDLDVINLDDLLD